MIDSGGPKPSPQTDGSLAPRTLSSTALSPRAAGSTDGQFAVLDAQLEELMGDAPVCDACGHITVRNGACYKCLNCGNSMGCS